MDFRVVLVEKMDLINRRVISSSGILVDGKFVLISSNLFKNELEKIKFRTDQMMPGKLYPDVFKKANIAVNVLWKKNELYEFKKARILSALVSGSVRKSNNEIFQNWAVDSIDNNTDIKDILSLFFILTFDPTYDVEKVDMLFRKWWEGIGHSTINKGDPIRIDSVPFGNRIFIDSCSKGIVSNIFGCNSCLIFSDAPSAPGSEGSPVYLDRYNQCFNKIPWGIVLSSANWWRGEWLGITLILDIRSLLSEVLMIKLLGVNKDILNHSILASIEFSLVQVYSGPSWGTAILLSEEKGIFITNSHILTDKDIKLHHKRNSFNASLIYKTPDEEVYDLAILQCEEMISEIGLKQITLAKHAGCSGDNVYAAGFAIFSKATTPSPTISKGCISDINRFMLKTTCCIHAGASGGAIIDEWGHLLGIIVCNVKLHDTNAVYSRINMAIPTVSFRETVIKYLETGDVSTLKNFYTCENEAQLAWRKIEGKL